MEPHVYLLVVRDLVAERKTVVGRNWISLILALGAHIGVQHVE
jgi:hypothetical protein